MTTDTPDILKKIVAHKQEEVAAAKYGSIDQRADKRAS